MASLLNDEAMAGQVDLIYMDPPYNINFRSNFQGLVNDTNVGEKWDDIPMDVRSVKAFRDSYQDGIHSYLDQLRTQLIHGRELLKDSGSFIMQIGPDNLHHVAVLMSEVFGHENHVATIPYTTRANSSTIMLPEVGNWLIWFAKNKPAAKYRQLYEETTLAESIAQMGFDAMYTMPDGESQVVSNKQRENPSLIPSEARLFRRMPLDSSHTSTTGRSDTWHYDPDDYPDKPGHYPEHSNAYPCPTGRQWSVSLEGLRSIAAQGRMEFSGERPSFRRYIDEVPGRMLNSMWPNISAPRDKRYIVETPPTVLQRILLMITDPGDLVLDPTSGSGAMPLMAERWGRRWIAIDASAISIAVARERIATAIHDYHLLQDSPEGHRKEHELAQNLLPQDKRVPFTPKAKYGNDPAKGFVLERQWRISAATLAYGFDGETPIYHPDRPHAAKGKNRVSSAFTVESDMPFSSIQPNAPETNGSSTHPGSIETMRNIEQALQESGIRAPAVNGDAPRTYRVTDLEPTVEIADATHIGRIAEGAGEARDAVFYICQEDEVAGPFQTRNLAVVARNRSASYACVIGFGHEGDSETIARQQGNITLLKVVANRDLMIPGLEHKSNDNAFVVISEPDLEFHDEPDGQISIEVQGLTAYNPATGQVEPAGDRKIAGVLTDTNYDQESFRVCLMNLPQTGQVAERRLKQIRDAFRREIDDAKWKRMRSTRTLPFSSQGPGGKIAVKVIDHTGVEHMKVLDAP